MSHRIFPAAVLALCLLRSLCAQTPVQNQAAFSGAAALTQLSYHWDSLSGGIPQVASTPRTPLAYAPSLTTLTWDPVGRPDLYQEKIIGGISYECTLVTTFTNPNGFWDAAPGIVKTLTYAVSGTTHYIFPYVTSGNDLRSYLTDTYFSGGSQPEPGEVALRIQQSLGLPAADASTRGLATFWVPLENLARPAYSASIGGPVSGLSTFSDGTYQPSNDGVPDGFQYVDVANNTILFTGAEAGSEFVSYNQAQTTYPWTAMGYTYNWNWLQDGANPEWGFDPAHADSPFGLSEFVVSGGSNVLLEAWIPHAGLALWLVPEPGAVVLIIFGLTALAFGRWKSAIGSDRTTFSSALRSCRSRSDSTTLD